MFDIRRFTGVEMIELGADYASTPAARDAAPVLRRARRTRMTVFAATGSGVCATSKYVVLLLVSSYY